MKRQLCTAPALVAVLLTATACGGSDDSDDDADGPSLAPSSSSGTTAVDDEAAIEKTIAAYDRALVTVNREQDVTPAFAAVATEAWADRLLTTYDDNLFSNGLVMLGRWRTKVETVKVDGDAAEVDVCIDGNKVYVVEGGEGIGNGAQSQGRFPGTVSLVRDSGGWKVDGTDSTEGSC